MPLTNPNHAVTAQRLQEFHQGILPYLNGPEAGPVVYGMRILRDESVPSEKVVYLEDAVGMTPAHMDYTNNVFDYGSWENAFFMPKPCMLKYDGTVDYYLDPNDYTKKEDSTSSDIANTSYGGNAMMEWPKIWLKIVPDSTKDNKQADIFISNEKVDEDYTDWSYHNALSESVDHFYTCIYPAIKIGSKLRSLSGQSVTSITIKENIDYAEANNPANKLIWEPDTVSDVTLITFLLILIGKSTDTSFVFGKGTYHSGSGIGYTGGAHNTKGLFYGTNVKTFSTANTVKVFGMENWWGFINRWCVGEVMINGSRKRKLTYGMEDGSTINGYHFKGSNLDGTGYVDCGVSAPSGTSESFISEVIYTQKGIFPVTTSNGSGTTYYADIMKFNNTGTMVMQHSSNGYGIVENGLGALYVSEAVNTNSNAGSLDSGGISARYHEGTIAGLWIYKSIIFGNMNFGRSSLPYSHGISNISEIELLGAWYDFNYQSSWVDGMTKVLTYPGTWHVDSTKVWLDTFDSGSDYFSGSSSRYYKVNVRYKISS